MAKFPNKPVNDTFKACDEFYANCVTKEYAFKSDRRYAFYNVSHQRGVWYGNGKLEIDVIMTAIGAMSCSQKRMMSNVFLYVFIVTS